MTFAALRRMVGDGPAHRANPEQFFHDGKLAARRAYGDVKLGVARFVLEHLIDRLETDGVDPTLDRAEARFLVTEIWQTARGSFWRDAAQATAVQTAYATLLSMLA